MASDHFAITAFPLQPSQTVADSRAWRVICAAERFAAGALLVLVSPLLSSAALILVLLSRRSPLIAHKRLGENGSSLWVLKLRTMWSDQKSASWQWVERVSNDGSIDLTIKSARDPRVTNRFAALCRRFSVDELPQLWHVIRGEMALVGPRPLTLPEVTHVYGCSAGELLSRKPGITGLWQVSGRSSLRYKQRRRLDLFMLRKWSFRLYLRILLSTVSAVASGRNAW